MKKLLKYLLMLVLLASCNQQKNITNSNIQEVKPITAAMQKKPLTLIAISFSKKANNWNINDFINVSFEVEEYMNKVILLDKMNCVDSDKSIDCSVKIDLSNLPFGIYRILVKSDKKGLLGSDSFEVSSNIIPSNITIDNESTGNYLILFITQQTGYREDEIYKRVAHIFSADPKQEYNLEPTLYDLFMFYHGDEDAASALNKLLIIIKENKPVAIKIKLTPSEVLKPAI